MMDFCPKCGALLIMKKTKFGCPRCNYIAKGNVNLKVKEEVNEASKVAVVSEKEMNQILQEWCSKEA